MVITESNTTLQSEKKTIVRGVRKNLHMITEMYKINFIQAAIFFEGALILFALGLGWLFDSSPLEQVRWELTALVLGFLGTVPLLLFIILCLKYDFKPIVRLAKWLDAEVLPLLRGASTLDLALISLFAGIGEEALFRGAIQGAVANVSGPWTGLLVASTLFGLAHFVTRTYAILAALFGLYLGWLTLVQNNLLTPIIIHTLYDFVTLRYMLARQD